MNSKNSCAIFQWAKKQQASIDKRKTKFLNNKNAALEVLQRKHVFE